MLLLRLIIGLAAGAWLYWDAKKRNFDWQTILLWSAGAVLLGAFAPPFLFFYIAFYSWRSRKGMMGAKRAKDAIDIEATIIDDSILQINCPMCASKVREDAASCPKCGYTLVPKCPKCGKELEREWKVCPYCQTPAMLK
ncbi:MAG: zinc ribbon domain-containing protein [Pelosinus sp.]|nr:zinc ribbon domain-containing protein [Pelosinus sp.]